MHDVGYGCFDTRRPDERHFGLTLKEVLEGIVAGLFGELYVQRTVMPASNQYGVRPHVFVYIEWAMPFMELDADRLHSKVYDAPTTTQQPTT